MATIGNLLAAALVPAALLTAQPALACAPPPPGWIPPTPAQVRSNGVGQATDIVYGRIEAQPGGAPALKVYHVYKGTRAIGELVPVATGYDFPVPVCAGMVPPPPPKPTGTYGVFLMGPYSAQPVLVSEPEVQAMIAEGLIRSAQAR